MQNTVIKFRDQEPGERFYDYLDKMVDFLHDRWEGNAYIEPASGSVNVSFNTGHQCSVSHRGLEDGRWHNFRSDSAFIIAYDNNGDATIAHCGSGGKEDMWAGKFKISIDTVDGEIVIRARHE